MSRLLTCGYETGDVNEAGVSAVGTNATLTVVNSSPPPRTGGRCLKALATGIAPNSAVKYFSLAAPKTDLWIRFGMYIERGTNTSSEMAFAGLHDGNGGDQTCLTWNPSTLFITLRGAVNVSGPVMGVSATPLTTNAWHLIEWRVQITSTSAGVTEVWQDGTRVINFAGDNTSSTVANVQALQLGNLTGRPFIGHYFAFDDLAINDTAGAVNNGQPGNGSVLLLAPIAAGGSTQWVRGGTDTGANWSQVSDVPASLSEYVASSTIGDRDLYTLADLPTAVSGINVVELVALGQNASVGEGLLAPTLKSGATISEAAAIGLSPTASYVVGRWEVDPNGGAGWTAAAVNALEVGATVR